MGLAVGDVVGDALVSPGDADRDAEKEADGEAAGLGLPVGELHAPPTMASRSTARKGRRGPRTDR
ncbi:MAG TPA: hypothetical protein VIV06_02695, partial [Candidatus Limnocylindrales bacterium]